VSECAEELLAVLVQLWTLITLDFRSSAYLGGLSSESCSGRMLEVTSSVSDRVLLRSRERGEEAHIGTARKEASSSARSALITSRSEEDLGESGTGSWSA
jgi:hypothetical protein